MFELEEAILTNKEKKLHKTDQSEEVELSSLPDIKKPSNSERRSYGMVLEGEIDKYSKTESPAKMVYIFYFFYN